MAPYKELVQRNMTQARKHVLMIGNVTDKAALPLKMKHVTQQEPHVFEVIKCTSSYITALLLYNMGIATAAATTIPPQELQLHPLYAGIATGVGSTTWQGLVPSKENQNLAIN